MPKNARQAGSSAVGSGSSQREFAMPQVIDLGTRSITRTWVRMAESVLARLGWMAGRVPRGVTPTLATSRWWR
jgi:hypothetical protein